MLLTRSSATDSSYPCISLRAGVTCPTTSATFFNLEDLYPIRRSRSPERRTSAVAREISTMWMGRRRTTRRPLIECPCFCCLWSTRTLLEIPRRRSASDTWLASRADTVANSTEPCTVPRGVIRSRKQPSVSTSPERQPIQKSRLSCMSGSRFSSHRWPHTSKAPSSGSPWNSGVQDVIPPSPSMAPTKYPCLASPSVPKWAAASETGTRSPGVRASVRFHSHDFRPVRRCVTHCWSSATSTVRPETNRMLLTSFGTPAKQAPRIAGTSSPTEWSRGPWLAPYRTGLVSQSLLNASTGSRLATTSSIARAEPSGSHTREPSATPPCDSVSTAPTPSSRESSTSGKHYSDTEAELGGSSKDRSFEGRGSVSASAASTAP